jgi:hypothetical protein
VAGRAHRDRDGLAADADLERLLDGYAIGGALVPRSAKHVYELCCIGRSGRIVVRNHLLSVLATRIFATRNGDDDRLPPKERVVYVEVSDAAFAVPFSSLVEKGTVTIETDEGDVVVRWRPGVASALESGTIAGGRDVGAADVALDGEPIPFHEPFWFAVAAFRPDVAIVDS